AVQLASPDQRCERCPVVRSFVAAAKQSIFSVQSLTDAQPAKSNRLKCRHTGSIHHFMLNDGYRPHSENGRLIRPWFLLGAITAAMMCADIPTSLGQALPPGGGSVPPLRRSAGGQIEIVPPSAPTHPEMGQRGTVPTPKAAP